MQIVEFYRGERGNNIGMTLEQIMKFSHGELEMDHDYIQWLFPSNEPSAMNGEAPVLTKEEAHILGDDPELIEKVKQSFLKILDFLGFELTINEDGGMPRITDKLPTKKCPKPQLWMEHFNHNMLRVTRIMKCLRLCGLTEEAFLFHEALERHKSKFSVNTWKYWTAAYRDPLW